jgi:hypothetical protein
VEIITQECAATAISGFAPNSDPRAAMSPRARPPKVFSSRIREENIRATVDLLSSSCQLSPSVGEIVKLHLVGDSDQDIDVLGEAFARSERPDQR